jgi:hypothetical protein
MLSMRISSLHACSVHASVPDQYAHCSAWFEDLFQIWNFYAYAEHTRKELMRTLSMRISS